MSVKSGVRLALIVSAPTSHPTAAQRLFVLPPEVEVPTDSALSLELASIVRDPLYAPRIG